MNPIFERASIRKFTDEKISKEQLDLLLKAGFAAPSAANKQPWEFVVVQNPDILEQLSKLSPYAGLLAGAALGIVVLADTRNHLDISYDIQDCAAASENILLEAVELGLGGCWLGFYPVQERVARLREFFDLPEHIVPMWILALGHPAQDANVKEKFKEEKIHYESYQK
jgi:nitroreductase